MDRRFFDEDFLNHPGQYLVQSALAGVTLWLAIIMLDLATKGIIIASLGATMFILFATPHRKSSQGRYVVGGYVMAGIIGLVIGLLSGFFQNAEILPVILNTRSMGAVAAGAGCGTPCRRGGRRAGRLLTGLLVWLAGCCWPFPVL